MNIFNELIINDIDYSDVYYLDMNTDLLIKLEDFSIVAFGSFSIFINLII